MADQLLRDQILHRADDELGPSVRLVVNTAWRDLPSDASLAEAVDRVGAAVDALDRHHAAASTAPEMDDTERACAALHSAARRQFDAERVADTLAADRIQFLETSLEFRERHGTQPCPVCAASALDDGWAVRARTALAAEKDAASALRVARSGAHRARQTVTALVRAVQPPPAADSGLPQVVRARMAYQSFTALPAEGDDALAEHVAGALPELRAAYAALGDAATEALGAARAAQTWLRALAGPG